jgi:(1->4)-alpha-D-glucan 1-alpha-D-glucosylmutase
VERVARHILLEQCPDHPQIEQAVAELIVHFPVYRSYLLDEPASARDRMFVEDAIRTLLENQPKVSRVAVDFLRDLLLNEGEFAAHPEFRKQRWPIARRFQQLTAPVTAKGVEDTAVYRFHRLISLNEVGCEPDHFGISSQKLHDIFRDRQQHWPNALSTLSTHDTKRSEDVRARLHVLADIPERWRDASTRWKSMNAQTLARHGSAPIDAITEFLIYQTILGAWLPGMRDADDTFVSRILAYTQKATREAKVNTNWTDPNADYESRVETFIRTILDRGKSSQFLDDFVAFAAPLTRIGYINSLAQTLVKFTAPGVPDTYQGTELWDFSLVDPDNRRPVDYDQRVAMVKSGEIDLSSALANPDDARIKLHVVQACLRARNDFAHCFQSGSYEPVAVTGKNADKLFAFTRRDEEMAFVVVVPRFPGEWMPFDASAPLHVLDEVFADATLRVDASTEYQDLLTGQLLQSDADGVLRGANLLSAFPVALLLKQR